MDIVQELTDKVDWQLIIGTSARILLILVIAWIFSAIIYRLLGKAEERIVKMTTSRDESPLEAKKRAETLSRLAKQATKILLWVTVLLIILREVGVEIGPILASAGVLGLAVGFGAQNLVRDVISGFFFILENQIRVGDVAVVNGTGGLVERINFRTIVLRDLQGSVHVFPNGAVTTLSNLTREWSAYVFDIGVAYKENVDSVIEVMKKVGTDLKSDEKFTESMLEEPEIFGLDKLGDSAVVIKGRIRTKPIKQWEVGREYLRRIKIAFDENNIEIPFPHRTLYLSDPDQAILQTLANGQPKETS